MNAPAVAGRGNTIESDADSGIRRSKGRLILILAAAVLVIATLCALGVWQIERRSWKLALIDRVETRVHAAPVAAPGPETWPKIDAAHDEYLRVSLNGHMLDGETLVRASTELGSGYWVLAPFRTDRGFIVLVNRGFVPPERRDPASHPAPSGETTVTGLLRITEPGGGFLRSNDPADGRWYSRDVAAIAAKSNLTDVAPYFVDAQGPGDGWPRAGLTRVVFPNNHLVYALTWFGMALALLCGIVVVLRGERGRRRTS